MKLLCPRARRVAAALAVVAAGGVRAADVPAPTYDARSTPAAPCGTGTPPPGHESPEVRPGAAGLTLVVRQDGSRLCYVHEGSADAPVIRVRQGADLAITLRNEISDPAAIDAVTAPGTLKVPNAPVPVTPGFFKVAPGMSHAATGATNLHLHGFAVPPVAPQDDVLTVCTDPAVGRPACGRREFRYRFHVPAAMPAGLYWYHPHVHGEVQAQMMMGLAGAIVVEGPDDDARRAAGMRERVLIVRQTQDLDAGKVAGATMIAAPDDGPGASAPAGAVLPVPTAVDTSRELLCSTGAGIDQISLNGTPVPIGDAPDEAIAHYEFRPGETQYWRVLNAATDAFLALALVDDRGRGLPLEVVARDGSPLADDAGRPAGRTPTTEVLGVPPSGRLEIRVPAPEPGTTAWLVTRAVDTGCSGDRLPERRLARLTTGSGPAAGTAATTLPPAPPATRAARRDLFSGLLARRTDRVRTIAMAEYPRPGTLDRTDFYLFERRPGAVLVPYMEGMPPAITVRAGSTEEWVIENWTHELHTFHIHQLHFRVLEIDGQPVAQPDLLDVVEVPYAQEAGYGSTDGPLRPGRVRIKLGFPPELAGDIPFHCHLVDHEDNGMMAVLRVRPAALRSR